MKANRNQPGIAQLVLLALLVLTPTARSEPRDILPPWPEYTLGIWGFNETFIPMMPSRVALGAESAQMAESWSGLALTRDAFTLSPVAVPVTDPFYRKRNFTTSVGTLRFWFRPEWSGVNAGGLGPRGFARLLELVTLSGKEPETLWSLYFSPEGDVIYLSGMGVGGATDFLKAEVKMTANRWHLISLNYDEKQTTLMVDAVVVATGSAMPPVASWKAEGLGLVIGSDITGANPALGWFDEACTFDAVQSAEDALWYRNSLRWTVVLGAVGTAKEEAVKQRWIEQLKFEEYGEPEKAPTVAYRPRPEELPTNALWLDISGVTNGVVTMRLQGTEPGTMYEILSQEHFMTNAGWQSEGVWVGTEGQDWTDTPVLVGTRTNQLFMQARSWKDEDGNGLPDWWEMQVFGSTGNDGYADADGDGWVNIQEYQNGTGPTLFNTPAAPQGVRVAYNSLISAVTVNWLPSQGAVTGYVIERFIWETGQRDFFTTGPTVTSHSETFPIADPNVFYYPPSYTVKTLYAQGDSQSSSAASLYDPTLGVQAKWVRNAAGLMTMVAPLLDPGIKSLLFTRLEFDPITPIPPGRTRFTVAVSNLQSGTFTLPIEWFAANGTYHQWVVQGTGDLGRQGEPTRYVNGSSEPFKDGRTHLRQNLNFLLRAANVETPFKYQVLWGNGWDYHAAQPDGYAFADFFWDDRDTWWGAAYIQEYRPFYDNYDYRNFVLTPTNVSSEGWLNTGVLFNFYNRWLKLEYPRTFVYTPEFAVTNIPAIVPLPGSRHLLQTWAPADGEWPQIGVSEIRTATNVTLTLEANARNIYGLPYLSMKFANGEEIITVPSGASIQGQDGYLYPEIANPVLQNVGYYFCNPNIGPFPGYTNFSTTNVSPVLFCSVGDPFFQVAGHAKYAIANGYTDKFAYLGLYFEKAYRANPDGSRSTNETGVLSPYGEFFATEPGKTFLTTKPDGVSTNFGECVVNVIKLQLDVNHDGVMDTSWTGPDNTSQAKPFVFWVNNDYDLYERDLNIPKGANCDDGVINGFRDLEDFARLWISGLPSLTSAQGYSVSLGWRNATGNPSIKLYRAYETNGGTAYLQNTNVALQQILYNPFYGGYGGSIGTVSPPGSFGAGSFTFPLNYFAVQGTNTHFLFEGEGIGKGELVLTIAQGMNVVAETSAWFDLCDVKDMYEQAHIANVSDATPNTLTSTYAEDKTFSDNASEDKSLIVFVHGWRMGQFDYYSFSESMFKRLYWQGYRGRFAALRWPTLSKDDFNSLAAVLNDFQSLFTYNKSEFRAFQSGRGVSDYLTHLRQRFPDRTIGVCAHSMGGIVMMQALKLQLAAGQTNIDNLVIMQAAVPAHCYDPSLANFAPFLAAETNIFSMRTPDTYRSYPGAINSAVRNQIVNFFNTNDFALATGTVQGFGSVSWEGNEISYKPDQGFGYSSDGTNAYKSTVLLSDARQIMSFVARPRSKAVGALSGVNGVIHGGQVDLKGNFGFDTDKSEHSAQFNWNIHRLNGFYSQLLTDLLQ